MAQDTCNRCVTDECPVPSTLVLLAAVHYSRLNIATAIKLCFQPSVDQQTQDVIQQRITRIATNFDKLSGT